MTLIRADERVVGSSAAMAEAISAVDWSHRAATVVGYGTMGHHHTAALQTLGVGSLRVCARSAGTLEVLRGLPAVRCISGGYERLGQPQQPDELGVIAVPTDRLVAVADWMAAHGYRRLLIEKPVALRSQDIEALARRLASQGVEAFCGYNRLAYPSLREAASRTAREGGMTSCTYTFTEMIRSDWIERFSSEELARWGIANSLHVIAMAHGLIGLPVSWQGYQDRAIDWHPTGSVFVGAGVSASGVPFAYHADWGSTGRWSLELHTPVASYRLCPLERLFHRASALAEWDEIPLTVAAPAVKAGLVEQAAAVLEPELRPWIPLQTLEASAALTRYAEAVFGYDGSS